MSGSWTAGGSPRYQYLNNGTYETITFAGTTVAPTEATGTMYYDTSTNQLKIYNGSAWVDI